MLLMMIMIPEYLTLVSGLNDGGLISVRFGVSCRVMSSDEMGDGWWWSDGRSELER